MPASTITTIATTAAGQLQGRIVAGGENGRQVVHFGGVPYGAATRFDAPQSALAWTGLRDATNPGAAPSQRSDGLDLVPDMTPTTTTEDCLTSEIWTTSVTEQRPVLVWIPGGSFRIGGAGLATYDGRHLAADGDVVVVGLNYRLGLFGFLCSPNIPSNLGLRDVSFGLAWIRANIAQFGGDPNRITLMGESAGAGVILHLLTIPQLQCNGAIVLSGSPTTTQQPATAELVTAKVCEIAGVATADELVGRSVDDLLDIQARAVVALAASVGMMPFHPWVDGDVVSSAPLQAMASGTLARVPLVVCTTRDEMELFRDVVPRLPRDYALKMLTAKGLVLGLTPAGVDNGLTACHDDLVAAIADVDLQLPALMLAEHHLQRDLPVWRATFMWQSQNHRACHALDLPFHFGTLNVADWRTFAAAQQPSADRLSRRLRAAWAAFAHTGIPSCEPIGAWPQFDDKSAVVELGRDVRVIPDPAGERLNSWRMGL